MSADLLDAFAVTEKQSISNTSNVNSQLKGKNDDDEDDFGDFEDPEGEGIRAETSHFDEKNVNSGQWEDVHASTDSTSFQQSASHSLASKIVSPSSANDSALSPNFTINPRSTVGAQYSSVYNAEDWGEYATEDVLFDADEVSKSEGSSEQQEVNERKPADSDVNDDWEQSWEALPVQQTPLVPSRILKGDQVLKGLESAGAALQTPPIPMVKDMGPPPMNVPPPSILIAFITTFFQSLPELMKELVDSATETNSNRVIKLQNTAAMIRASAHIIAGRKQRWKRDTMLAQGMRIGPAGNNAAMKLTSVDKSEIVREDHQVAEALEVWRQQRGKLRSSVAKANTQVQGLDLMLPDLAETMPIRQGKEGEGALTAPKPCFLCGIKRDERVAKLDVFVEDSFGEWWREYWGHTECVIFWDECKQKLLQR